MGKILKEKYGHRDCLTVTGRVVISTHLVTMRRSTWRASSASVHDDVIKREHFPRYLPFMLVTGEFPAQRPVTRSFDVFYDLRLNKRLSKQSWGWWFETHLSPLWRHCNGIIWILPNYCEVFSGPYHKISQRMCFERWCRSFGSHVAESFCCVSFSVWESLLTGDMWFIYSYLSGLFHWHRKHEGHGCNLSIPNHNKTQQTTNRALH